MGAMIAVTKLGHIEYCLQYKMVHV
jgi:hypothetical protein